MKYLGVVLGLKYADNIEYGVVVGKNIHGGYYTAWITNCSEEQALKILRLILFNVLQNHSSGITSKSNFELKYIPELYLDKFRGVSTEMKKLLEKLCNGQKDNSYLYITKVSPNVRI